MPNLTQTLSELSQLIPFAQDSFNRLSDDEKDELFHSLSPSVVKKVSSIFSVTPVTSSAPAPLMGMASEDNEELMGGFFNRDYSVEETRFMSMFTEALSCPECDLSRGQKRKLRRKLRNSKKARSKMMEMWETHLDESLDEQDELVLLNGTDEVKPIQITLVSGLKEPLLYSDDLYKFEPGDIDWGQFFQDLGDFLVKIFEAIAKFFL